MECSCCAGLNDARLRLVMDMPDCFRRCGREVGFAPTQPTAVAAGSPWRLQISIGKEGFMACHTPGENCAELASLLYARRRGPPDEFTPSFLCLGRENED